MPFFASSSGVQINGGRFYDIAGDMNLQNTQLAATERELTMLPSGMTTESIRQSHEQHSAAAKMASDSPATGGNPIYLSSMIGVHLHQPENLPHLNAHSDRTRNLDSGSIRVLLRPNVEICLFMAISIALGQTTLRFQMTRVNLLMDPTTGDAFHNSADRYPQPKCHPETRTEMLHDLHDWFFTDDPESRVLWLHGPAGSGKSAIAQSLCQKLEAEGNLGGSFFFKRGHPSRGHSRKLFSTIAYQLALLLPEFKHVVSKRVEEDPSLVQKSLSIQLRTLIVEPCRDSAPTRTFAVVIDGLDECEGQDIQQEILRCIGNSFYQSELPIRFIVASRPEPHIGETFCDPCLGGLHLTLNIQQSFEDVREYLVDEFARIHREHRETMATVSSPWPAQDVVAQLVEKSSGYFIYASTVIKFIDDKDFRPTDRLDVILGIAESDVGSMSPFTALDQLYIQILSDLPARSQLLRILAVIAVGLHSTLRIPKIEQLIELRPGDVRLTLRRLQSVIELPLDDEDTFLAGIQDDQAPFAFLGFSIAQIWHARY
ncbi:hypothetical protein FB451DRAFT_1390418 [Mycena latifolia]|nr:hypothetical protein FB451DRAFT_1390418 [Mycena latifolia]